MCIFLLYTCDVWQSAGSRVLRGIFTENTLEALEKAKKDLIYNGVVASEEEIYVYEGYDGECETNGGYLVN